MNWKRWMIFACMGLLSCDKQVVSFLGAEGGAGGASGMRASGSSTTGGNGGATSDTAGAGGSSSPTGGIVIVGPDGGGGGTFAKLDMLSDFEPAHRFGFNPNRRWSGAWLVDGDMTPGAMVKAEIDILDPAHDTFDGYFSTQALHVTSNGQQQTWGSSWYAILKGGSMPFDASGYTGITFWARSDGPVIAIKVAIVDLGSYPNPGDAQPVCDLNDTTVGGRACYDDYAIKIYADGDWRRYEIPFSTLATAGWGLAHAFDPTRLYQLKFSSGPGVPYSEWMDDIAFYTR